MNFEFMTIDTPLPPCMPFPRALTGFPVSSTAKVMYCRMLDAMLALDEPKRLARLNKEKDISLLAKYGLTEADAWRLCEKYDMLSPCYQHSKRNGCWFCPNASNSELSHMVNRHPELFDRLIEWERTDNLYHRRLTRTETPSEVKARLMSKPQPEFSISKQ